MSLPLLIGINEALKHKKNYNKFGIDLFALLVATKLEKGFTGSHGDTYCMKESDNTYNTVNEKYFTGKDIKENRQALLDAIKGDLKKKQLESSDYQKILKNIDEMESEYENDQ